MIRRGWTDRDIALVLGGNFRRLLTRVWAPAGLDEPDPPAKNG